MSCVLGDSDVVSKQIFLPLTLGLRPTGTGRVPEGGVTDAYGASGREQQITLAQGKPGTLLSRYRVFVEKFLAKVAEAESAERPVKDNVVKDAFKEALKGENVLKMWMREVNWRGVDKTHRRLMRKLKESHSWDQLRDESERKGAKWRRMEDGE